jgi:hypothetical protein
VPQPVPSVTFVCTHPVAGLQVSVVQTFVSAQLGGVPAWHAPARHVSAPLQALPSPQDAPSAAGLLTQPPAALQVSTVQGLPSLAQAGGVPARQAPDWHVSAPLQALPSPQLVPLATAAYAHMPLLQALVVQGLLSLHWLALVQEAQPEIGVVVQPVAGTQASVVHGLPSLHESGVPARQTPALHVSAPSQAFPSSQTTCAQEQPTVLTAAPAAVPSQVSDGSRTPSPSLSARVGSLSPASTTRLRFRSSWASVSPSPSESMTEATSV